MNYELFFGGIAALVFAYVIYKTRNRFNPASKQKYYGTAQKLNVFALILMSVSAGLFFIAESLVR